jgi:hypothetical protein
VPSHGSLQRAPASAVHPPQSEDGKPATCLREAASAKAGGEGGQGKLAHHRLRTFEQVDLINGLYPRRSRDPAI